MNIAIINVSDYGSTGRIACGLHTYLLDKGHNAYLCYGRGGQYEDTFHYKIDTELELRFHAIMTRLLGDQGFYSYYATKRLIKFIEEKEIELIYAENLHSYYINEKMFFDYIIEKNIPMVYIMADEYPFLGKCGFNCDCNNYLQGCGRCPQVHYYPKSFWFDRSRKIFQMKRLAYQQLSRAKFVAPEFVIKKAKTSPLIKGTKIQLQVLDEAIDTRRCVPKDNKEIRKKFGISEDKIIIVCVAVFPKYGIRKGGEYFLEAARMLEDDNRFYFIHAGFQMDTKICPSNYLPIKFVSPEELPEYYSVADLFVFPSLYDTMPNTCLEALACGTPLLCFNTSGMPYLGDESVLTLVEPRNVEQIVEVIKKVKPKNQTVIDTCRDYALSRYDNQKYFAKLYDISKDL